MLMTPDLLQYVSRTGLLRVRLSEMLNIFDLIISQATH